MALHYELEANQYSIRVYDSERGNMDYVSSALVQVNGDVAWVRQVSSPVFIECLVENLEMILKGLGVTRLEGLMNPAMARMLRIKASGVAKYEELKHVLCSGRDLIWVALESFSSEAGAGKHLNPRQKEYDMGLKTYKMVTELTNSKGEVEYKGEMVWNGLDAQRVAFLEKHLIGGLVSLNKDASEIIATLK